MASAPSHPESGTRDRTYDLAALFKARLSD